MNEIRTHHLIEQYLSGGLCDDDRESLELALLASPAARELYWRLADTHADMREWGLSQFGMPSTWQLSGRHRWSLWLRSFAAMVAVLTFAIGSLMVVGVAWAIAPRPRPIIQKTLPVADPGFEDGVAPATQPPSGCTLREILPSYGTWAADGVRITGPEQGVTPYEGNRMLCFQEPLPAPGAVDDLRSVACDLFQFVDLTPMAKDLSSGEATLELTAHVCDAVASRGLPIYFIARIFVYDSSPTAVGDCWPDARLDAVAMNQTRLISATPDGKWKTVSTKTLLPAGSKFALIHLTCDLGYGHSETLHLGQQFCDDVRLVFSAPATHETAVGESSHAPH